jgi:hypothetical protein
MEEALSWLCRSEWRRSLLPPYCEERRIYEWSFCFLMVKPFLVPETAVLALMV